jgi:hypothetical protein
MPAQARIKPRRDTSANWASANPVLQSGEIGFDTTTSQFKIGDGTTAWSSLSYVTETPSGAQTKADTAESDAISAAAADATSQISTHAGLTATHGATGAIVGTTNTQTLTNKTIDGNSNTLTVLNAQTTATASANVSTIVLRDSSANTAINQITLGADPSSAMQAVTKQYADNISAGIHAHEAVDAATTANLATTYAAGTIDASGGYGIGATLTATSNGAISVDSYSAALNDRILVKNQTTATQNGIYTVSTVGTGGTPFVLTRATDADNSQAGEFKNGDFVFALNGTVNANMGFVMTSAGTSSTPAGAILIGTDNVAYTQFTGAASITATAPLQKSGNTLSIDAATQSVPGYLSAADKTKIDALEMPISFHIAGTLSAGVKQPRFISPVACTLVNARAYAGGGSAVTYRLVKNGSTNSNTSATVGAAVVTTSLSTVTSLAVGDTLQVEIVSAGTSGADLSVTIEATY